MRLALSDLSIIERYKLWPTGEGGYLLRINGEGKLAFANCHDSSACDPVIGNTTVTAGVWHHVAGVWDGAARQTVSGGNVTSNNLVWKKVSFSAIITTEIRVVANRRWMENYD